MERDAIGEWISALRLPRRRRQAIARELQSHLADAQRDLELTGWLPQEAARESLRRLGDPAEIVEAFSHVYRRPRRTTVGLAVALALALLGGAWGASVSLASATAVRTPAVPAHVVHQPVSTAHHCTSSEH